MQSRSKILLLTLSLICLAIIVTACLYQRHLRFLMTDFSKATPPATPVVVPTTGIKPIKNPLVLDGIQLPFAEADIRGLRTREDTSAIVVELTSGVTIILYPPQRGYSKIQDLRDGMAWDLASRKDFRWTMTSAEVEQLEDRILDRGGELEVRQVGFRDEAVWHALLRMYAKIYDIHEVTWTTSDEKWGGIAQFMFKKSPELSGDATKQLEFLSQFKIASAPQGNYAEELKALVERVRAKNPGAVRTTEAKK